MSLRMQIRFLMAIWKPRLIRLLSRVFAVMIWLISLPLLTVWHVFLLVWRILRSCVRRSRDAILFRRLNRRMVLPPKDNEYGSRLRYYSDLRRESRILRSLSLFEMDSLYSNGSLTSDIDECGNKK